MNRFVRFVATFAFLTVGSGSVFACPLCKTETGGQVRTEIFGDDFGTNLFLTVLPFIILIGFVLLIYFGPPWGKGSRFGQHGGSAEFLNPNREG